MRPAPANERAPHACCTNVCRAVSCRLVSSPSYFTATTIDRSFIHANKQTVRPGFFFATNELESDLNSGRILTRGRPRCFICRRFIAERVISRESLSRYNYSTASTTTYVRPFRLKLSFRERTCCVERLKKYKDF